LGVEQHRKSVFFYGRRFFNRRGRLGRCRIIGRLAGDKEHTGK